MERARTMLDDDEERDEAGDADRVAQGERPRLLRWARCSQKLSSPSGTSALFRGAPCRADEWSA